MTLTLELAQALGTATKTHVAEKLAPLQVQIEALAARVKALEARPGSTGVKWSGVWEPSKIYHEGDLVTRSGSLWLSLRDTGHVPGADPQSWRLIVKQGHAG